MIHLLGACVLRALNPRQWTSDWGRAFEWADRALCDSQSGYISAIYSRLTPCFLSFLRYARSESIFSRQHRVNNVIGKNLSCLNGEGEIPQLSEEKDGSVWLSSFSDPNWWRLSAVSPSMLACLWANPQSFHRAVFSSLYLNTNYYNKLSYIVFFVIYQSGFTTDIEWADWSVAVSRDQERVLCVVFLRICSESKGAWIADSQLTWVTCADTVVFAQDRYHTLRESMKISTRISRDKNVIWWPDD